MKGLELILKSPLYKLQKYIDLPIKPFSYVYLLSFKCNSKCKTCGLWKKNNDNELKTKEWFRIIKEIGNSAAWVTLTGGEPFCLPDIDKIAIEVLKINKPKVLCIPSNGSMPEIIDKKVRNILKTKGNYELILNLSVDAIGEDHDKVRGMKGASKKLVETIKLLKLIKDKRFKLSINTVISPHNLKDIFKIYDYVVNELKPDDYIFETAQQRSELNTKDKKFIMDKKKLDRFLKFLVLEQTGKLFSKRGISFLKNTIRLSYYRNLLEKKRFKCNAGLLSCQIMPDGKVVTCGVLGQVLGDLKKDSFKIMWKKAKNARQKLRKKMCFCQLANIYYINKF